MRISTLFTLALISWMGASAENVVSSAGSLSSLLSNPAEIETLAIEGSVNASDLKFIAEKMTALRSLDLSAATVAASKGDAINGNSSFDANAIPAFVFAGSAIEEIRLPASLKEIGDGAFAGSALRAIAVGANVDKIGCGTFAGCRNLAEATIESATVGDGTFAGCASLATVTLSAPATTIGSSSFSACPSLTDVNGAENITSIGAGAFAGCTSLTDLAIGEALTSIGAHAFARSAISSLSLPSIKSIDRWALADMPALTTLQAPAATSAGEGSLMGNTSLSALTLSTDLDRLGDFALAYVSALQALDLSSAQSIGQYALSHATSLEELTLGESLKQIGSRAMESNTSLTTIESKATAVPSLGEDVWDGVEQASVKVIVPDEAENDYKAAAQWREFNIVSVTTNGAGSLTIPSLGINAAFDGMILNVSCDRDPIAAVELYTIDGRKALSAAPATHEASLDTSALSDNIFIVTVATPGATTSFKLARN